MKDTDGPTKITLKPLQTHLQSYESHVPEKIQGLESLRLNEIPETLAQRKKDGDAFLEKTEVTSLVEWKLCVRPGDCGVGEYTQALTSWSLQKAWHLPPQPRQARCLKQR